MKIQDYDSNCGICKFLVDDEIDKIYEGEHIEAALNPRWSPHALRMTLIPLRHIGEDGKYGLGSLNMDERFEYGLLRKKATEAINSAAESTSNQLKVREGQPLIDYLERPSVHPSGDLIPQYERAAKIGNTVFPRYLNDEIESNSSGVRNASVIVASFPKSASEKLTMPESLRKEMVSILKECFESV